MRFDNIIIIGSGKIACDCLEHLLTLVDKNKLLILESAKNKISMLERICKKQNIVYKNIAGGVLKILF